MLVLTRKPEEQILIGDDIQITIVKVRGNQVRIGINAPDEVRVMRGELEPKPEIRAKQRGNRESATSVARGKAETGVNRLESLRTATSDTTGTSSERKQAGTRRGPLAVYSGRVSVPVAGGAMAV